MVHKTVQAGSFITNFKTNVYKYIPWENNPKLEPVMTMCVAFVILTITIERILRRKKKFSRKKSLYDVLPRIQWTSLNLSMIDVFITMIKFRKHGVRVCDKLIAMLGPNFTSMIPGHKIVVVSDPKIVQKVLSSTKPQHLNKPTFIYKSAFTNGLKDSLLVSDFDTWSPHRKAISPAFNYKFFPNFVKIINEEGKCLVKSAYDFAAKGNGCVDKEPFKNLLEYHLTKLLARIVIGSESINMPDTYWDQLHNTVSRIIALSAYRQMNTLLWIPFLWDINKRKREKDELMRVLRELAKKIIDDYKVNRMKQQILIDVKKDKVDEISGSQKSDKNLSVEEDLNSKIILADKVPESMLEHMIKAGLTEKEMLDELHLLVLAGQDTSLAAMDFFLFHLASNVQIQKNCQDEISRLMETHGYTEDENFSLEHLSELKYLERCILESLRLTPSVPSLLRRIDKDLDLDDEYMIEAGQHVMIVPWGVHRNPKDFPNPETFDPDRFLPENVKKRNSYSFIPFSMGARNCVGWKLALLQLKVFSSWILRNFDITTNDKLSDVKIQVGITILPERPLDLHYKIRK